MPGTQKRYPRSDGEDGTAFWRGVETGLFSPGDRAAGLIRPGKPETMKASWPGREGRIPVSLDYRCVMAGQPGGSEEAIPATWFKD